MHDINKLWNTIKPHIQKKLLERLEINDINDSISTVDDLIKDLRDIDHIETRYPVDLNKKHYINDNNDLIRIELIHKDFSDLFDCLHYFITYITGIENFL